MFPWREGEEEEVYPRVITHARTGQGRPVLRHARTISRDVSEHPRRLTLK